MQIFACPACGATVWFHNLTCTCGADLTFSPATLGFTIGDPPCSNRAGTQCNWAAAGEGQFCLSCAMTKTIPDLALPENAAHWQAAEGAKRWALVGLMRMGWFGPGDGGLRPVFDLIAEQTAAGPADVTMGHAEGAITINVSEADPARITARQVALGEPFRTLIGHMRHEIAHALHWRLSDERPGFAEAFRAVFGDERADYAAALAAHYADPQPASDDFVTSYATARPHEDWAETVAHLLNLLDIVDSFAAAGLALPRGPVPDAYDPAVPTAAVLTAGGDLGLALNHVNRAVGQPDLYPFVLGAGVRAKMAFARAALTRQPG